MVCDCFVAAPPDACAVVLALMTVVIAFIYMASQAFKRPEWEALAKAELYQLFISALIIVFALGFAHFACTLSCDFAGGNPFDIADEYIRTLLFKMLLPSIFQLFEISYSARMLDSIFYRVGPGSWCYNFKPFPGTGAIDHTATFINTMLGIPFGSLIVQTFILQFIKGTMYTLLLPAGLILRILPPTRDAGVFLIVTAIAFQVFFPLTYVWHKVVLMDYIMQMEHYGTIAGTDWTGSWGAGSLGGFGTVLLTDWNPLFILKPIQTLSYVLAGSIFLPALTMIIVVTFIKGSMKFLSQRLE